MIQRVVVGIDFSPASHQALERAALWAKKLDVPLEAIHVLLPPAPMLPEAQVPLPDPAWLESMETHAKDQLASWVKDIPRSKATVSWGSPAEELVNQADGHTLLVVAQVGHSALANFLFGSTAARVIRHAPCDVLVVRGDQK